MEKLTYSVSINASKELVWKTMLEPETYREWVKPFSSDTIYEGSWEQGAEIKFIDPGKGGTKAFIEKLEPNKTIFAKHIAVLLVDGSEDTESEMAREWIGTTEEYRLEEKGGVTILTVEMETYPPFVDMFNTRWPEALKILKRLCEESVE